MKHFIVVLLISLIFLLKPITIFAEDSATTIQSCFVVNKATPSAGYDEEQDGETVGFWSGAWNWLWGKFKKTDYGIGLQRPKDDLTNYGNITTKGFKKKQSFIGSRAIDSKSQNCLKGNVIKKVILGEDTNYPDEDLSQICLDQEGTSGCENIRITNLAYYFIQINKNFYCDENNNSIEIEQSVKDKASGAQIPSSKFDCYNQIYNEFYLTTKKYDDDNNNKEGNINNIVKTAIPKKYQDSNKTNQEVNEQLRSHLSPEKYKESGFSGLIPQRYKE